MWAHQMPHSPQLKLGGGNGTLKKSNLFRVPTDVLSLKSFKTEEYPDRSMVHACHK